MKSLFLWNNQSPPEIQIYQTQNGSDIAGRSEPADYKLQPKTNRNESKPPVIPIR